MIAVYLVFTNTHLFRAALECVLRTSGLICRLAEEHIHRLVFVAENLQTAMQIQVGVTTSGTNNQSSRAEETTCTDYCVTE